MRWDWGFLLLFAWNALAAGTGSSNASQETPKTEHSLSLSLDREIERSRHSSSDSSQVEGEPSLFGRLGRSLSVHDRIRRSMSMVPSFGEPSSPTTKLDTIEIAEYYGYGAERHSVITEDGYVLEVHRIYNTAVGEGGTGTGTRAKPVVVIQHGFLMDSKSFLILGPKALGYFLADKGYDVWLSNFRGNTYSRKHIRMSPDSQEFWDFSYTEHGVFDLPAVIHHALEVTGRNKVHYIGHSMGTLSFLIMASKRPEMLLKVQTFTALAPITTATDGRAGVLRLLMKNYKTIARGFEQVGVFEFMSRMKRVAGIPTCSDIWYSKIACSAIILSLAGENPYFDTTIIDDILAYIPSGSSVKTFRHFGQNYFNGFREYDYGAEENIAKYNSKEPPIFNFSKMKVPSQIYFGVNDLMADVKGAIEICKILPKVYRCEAVDDVLFGHGDFLWATNAPSLVYQRLLEGLRRFEKDDQQQ